MPPTLPMSDHSTIHLTLDPTLVVMVSIDNSPLCHKTILRQISILVVMDSRSIGTNIILFRTLSLSPPPMLGNIILPQIGVRRTIILVVHFRIIISQIPVIVHSQASALGVYPNIQRPLFQVERSILILPERFRNLLWLSLRTGIKN